MKCRGRSRGNIKPRHTEPSHIIKESYPCPYFKDGRTSTLEFLLPSADESDLYHKFLARGYRRIGRAFYRNICEKCVDCIPLRLEIDTFNLSRSHKRTAKRNDDIRVKVLTQSHITADKISLYNKYVNSKHPDDKPEVPTDSVNTLINIHYGYTRAIEMNYYLHNRLIGVGIVDEGDDALSSNYFYYDTDHLDRRLGIFSILQEIALARTLAKKYYYLGFYIEENPKMSYKKYFRPNQVFRDGRWTSFI